MESITSEELAIIEESVENIFIEESATITFPRKDGIHTFSKTFKLGMSININQEIGYEKTIACGKNIIRKYLLRLQDECLRLFKNQNII